MSPTATEPGFSVTEALLDQAAAGDAWSARLARLKARKPVAFEHVAPAVYSFVSALIVRQTLADAGPARETTPFVWIACGNIKIQEAVHAELSAWGVDALFLPEYEFAGFEEAIPDPEAAAERLATLQKLEHRQDPRRVVVLQASSFDESAPRPGTLTRETLTWKPGDTLDFTELGDRLTAAGYERASQVYQRGQFAVRGGILDVFSWQSAAPVRVELFGDEIESLREFHVDDQMTRRQIDRCEILLGESSTESGDGILRDYLANGDLVVAVEAESDLASVAITPGVLKSLPDAGAGTAEEDYEGAAFDNPLGNFEAGDFILQESRRDEFTRQMEEWRRDGWTVAMCFHSLGEQERFSELVDRHYLDEGLLLPFFGNLNRGFTIPSARLALLSDSEIFGRYQHQRAQRRFRREEQRRQVSQQAELSSFTEGDLVVHADYGIGRFKGILIRDARTGGDTAEEVLEIEYAEQARLFVPLDQAHLVSRYIGVGRKAPKLNRLGSKSWSKTKAQAERSILDYAAHLLKTQADREVSQGIDHGPDTRWQWEFENSFIYKETPDQLLAIEDSKRDMETNQPMDRLICGDVGFGKTEVAIRAAFKAVMSGYQVAFLVPTTVLAQQHYQTLRERMSDYPVTIDLLSRYRTQSEQRQTVEKIRSGSVDIVIGTHRLISKDVEFKNLGLVVIDEEQRFGVMHKERFKELFRLVDVLTLSATPIPRTLYLSLMGAKDMSTIETPPPNRFPVHTTVCGYDERIIRDAIKRELKRQGQVFYLHNRVRNIELVKRRIEELVPGARVGVGHGQMHESDLEDIMNQFIKGELDVLVCTTIIESGVDIPNANTILIDRADRFGLADLYQLRGRVGRADHRAYAILMLPRDMMTVGDARKRINAIKQYSSLGAGFRIAMRDLEIRGAGNLLGTQQSGHMAAVGFDLYCQLLKQSVARLKGQDAGKRIDVSLYIDFLCTNEAEWLRAPEDSLPAFIPASYMPEARLRISAYRQIAEAGNVQDLKDLTANWRDRFGKLPAAAENLLICAELRIRAANNGISTFEIRENKLMLTKRGQFLQLNGRFPRLSAETKSRKLREALTLMKQI